VQRLTLDTNILISAVAFGGNPARLLEKALVGEVEIFISDEIMAEFSRVIRRPKFGFDAERIAEAQAYIKKCTKRVEPQMRLDVVPDDPDDNRIVECAVESGSEKIITHDKDLLRMGSYQGIEMVMVHEFLREGLEGGH
jgi:putative PIN family toxin of toxin-antitoxin system